MLPRAPLLSHIVMRGAGYGARSAVRPEGLTTSIGSLFGVLLLVQLALLLVFGVHARLQLLKEQVDVRLEVLETATTTDISSLLSALEKQDYIDDVIYVTQAQAYEKVRQRDPELISFLEQYDISNPFPETIGIRLKQIEKYQQLVLFLQNEAFANTVDPNFLRATDQDDQLRTIEQATITARTFLFVVVGVLAIVLLFILIELVRRRVVLRREEILIQQLVGATPLTILIPFGFEILVLLLASLALSLLATTCALFVLPMFVPSLSTTGVFGPWVSEMRYLMAMWVPLVILIEVAAQPILALLGSFLGLWPRLKRPTLSMS